MTHLLRVLVVVLCSGLLVGCGGGDAGKDGPKARHSEKPVDPALAALADALVKSTETIVDRAEAECMGTHLIDEVGTDQLVTWGVLDKSRRTADLSGGPDEFEAALAPALSRCVGIAEASYRMQRMWLKEFAETPEDKAKAADDAYWVAVVACVDERIPEDLQIRATIDEDLPKDVEAQITRDWKQCEKDAAAH
ncbi:hypothetical protein [Pimelobacter simplex]|uniref:hypothetical protein n=1 Tax=Nocardioides simplex TaxID=2045 RepID=UPI003AB00C82